ncbi:MAG: ATP-binding protein, partial [Acidimicrobiales bacterium]|nr:ATP-binding protein [Acidimicrobiales bacterium]
TLDFSKLEAGKLELDLTDFDFAKGIDSLISLVTVSAEAKGVIFVTEISPLIPAALCGDEGRLRQVLVNLVGNAVKFTESGTVTIRAHALPHCVDSRKISLHIEIEDTGIGISGDPSRLFEPFSQAGPAIARKFGGTGLGLAICARLVEAMSGTISVTSHPGRGSVFRLAIPFEQGNEPALALSDGPVRPRGVRTKERGVVLIVDDDRTNRFVASQMVRHLGYSCDTATNGLEALDMLQRKNYAAVLMDCFMPELDGFDATVELRVRESGERHTPIIATTAGALDGDRAQCEAAGMDDYVSKPLTLDHLELVLNRSASDGGTD